jgi:hypothetical protein
MSIQARDALVNSPKTVFQRNSQRVDLLNPDLTQTTLIALLTELVAKGHIILFTAVRSDHHDDSGLGRPPNFIGTHAHGWAADCWPMNSSNPTDFIDAGDERFQTFLADAAASTWLHQIGLAGTADTADNRAAAGPTVFPDDGADHVHLGSQ